MDRILLFLSLIGIYLLFGYEVAVIIILSLAVSFGIGSDKE